MVPPCTAFSSRRSSGPGRVLSASWPGRRDFSAPWRGCSRRWPWATCLPLRSPRPESGSGRRAGACACSPAWPRPVWPPSTPRAWSWRTVPGRPPPACWPRAGPRRSPRSRCWTSPSIPRCLPRWWPSSRCWPVPPPPRDGEWCSGCRWPGTGRSMPRWNPCSRRWRPAPSCPASSCSPSSGTPRWPGRCSPSPRSGSARATLSPPWWRPPRAGRRQPWSTRWARRWQQAPLRATARSASSMPRMRGSCSRRWPRRGFPLDGGRRFRWPAPSPDRSGSPGRAFRRSASRRTSWPGSSDSGCCPGSTPQLPPRRRPCSGGPGCGMRRWGRARAPTPTRCGSEPWLGGSSSATGERRPPWSGCRPRSLRSRRQRGGPRCVPRWRCTSRPGAPGWKPPASGPRWRRRRSTRGRQRGWPPRGRRRQWRSGGPSSATCARGGRPRDTAAPTSTAAASPAGSPRPPRSCRSRRPAARRAASTCCRWSCWPDDAWPSSGWPGWMRRAFPAVPRRRSSPTTSAPR